MLSDETQPIKRHAIATWHFFVIFVVGLGVSFYPLLINQVLFWKLPSLQFYPWRQFAFHELREGRFPFWNPYVGGGAPLIANYQSAILYPPNWLHLFLPNTTAMNLLVIFHLFWAGLGMWQLTHCLKLSNLGRGVSVLSFVFGIYSMGHIGDFPLSATTAWLPWLFWAVWRVMEKRHLSDAGVVSIITAFQLLGGHAQNTWYGFLAIGIFVLWCLVWQLKTSVPRARIRALILCVLGILLGTGIASGQLLMTFEFLLQSHRTGGVDYDTLTRISYAPWRLINLVSPDFFGRPQNGSYRDTYNSVHFEDTVYIGILPLISIFFAMSGWRERRKFLHHHVIYQSVPFWLFLSILGYILALGQFTPLYRFLYDYVPTFDAFRSPVKWLVLPSLGLSILAGIGVHNWSRSQITLSIARLSVVGAGTLGIITIVALLVLDIPEGPFYNLIYAVAVLCVLLIGCAILTLLQPQVASHPLSLRWQLWVLIFIAADLLWVSHGLNVMVSQTYYERDYSITPPQGRLYWFEDYMEQERDRTYFTSDDYEHTKERWIEIRTSLLPNQNMADKISTLNNFDALQPSLHRQYIELIEENPQASARLLWAANVGQVYGVTAPEGWEGTAPEFLSSDEPHSMWMVQEAIWVKDNAEATEVLRSPDWDPQKTVILQGESNSLEEPVFTETPSVRILEETPNKIRYRITSDGAGYLVIPNTWYPGWQAQIDGEETTLYQANLAFQAIYIPSGGGDVTLSYTPRTVGIGFTISVFALFVTLLLTALGLFQYDTNPSVVISS